MTPNPFKNLPENESIKAPPELENKIFGTFEFLNSMLKIIELYMGNFFSAILGMVNISSNNNLSNEAPANNLSVTDIAENDSENSNTT